MVTNVEFFQLLVLTEGGFQASTPKPFMFPRMRDPSERETWVKYYAEFPIAAYTVIKEAVSETTQRPKNQQTPAQSSVQPSQQFKLPKPKVYQNKKRIMTGDEVCGTILGAMIMEEYHQISSMIQFESKAPGDFLKGVFTRLSAIAAGQKYPSELINEFSKFGFVTVLLEEITRYIRTTRPEFKLTQPNHLETETRGRRCSQHDRSGIYLTHGFLFFSSLFRTCKRRKQTTQTCRLRREPIEEPNETLLPGNRSEKRSSSSGSRGLHAQFGSSETAGTRSQGR